MYVSSVQNRGKTEEYCKVIEEVQGEAEKWRGKVVVVGDFNSRLGQMTNVVLRGEGKEEERLVLERTSEDEKSTAKGKYFLKAMNAAGLVVANG